MLLFQHFNSRIAKNKKMDKESAQQVRMSNSQFLAQKLSKCSLIPTRLFDFLVPNSEVTTLFGFSASVLGLSTLYTH